MCKLKIQTSCILVNFQTFSTSEKKTDKRFLLSCHAGWSWFKKEKEKVYRRLATHEIKTFSSKEDMKCMALEIKLLKFNLSSMSAYRQHSGRKYALFVKD